MMLTIRVLGLGDGEWGEAGCVASDGVMWDRMRYGAVRVK